jgi:hypothetical protein
MFTATASLRIARSQDPKEGSGAHRGCDGPNQGTREIRVILYAKDDSFCAPAPADELSNEDVLAVEHDVIPLDGADVFQQGEVDSIGHRVAALTQDPGDSHACQ